MQDGKQIDKFTSILAGHFITCCFRYMKLFLNDGDLAEIIKQTYTIY